MKRYLFYIVFVAFFVHCNAQTGIITTIVGTGYPHDTGDGGQATAAGICSPTGVSNPDKYGNYYIAERYCNIVKKISASGIITTFAGTGTAGYSGDGGPATTSMIKGPFYFAYDTIGNLYISELDGNRIRKIDVTTNTITTYAGNGAMIDSGDGRPATNAAIYSPHGICFDKHGNMYIASYDNYIRKIDGSTQTISTIFGNGNSTFTGDGGPATAASGSDINVYADSSDNLIFADQVTRIRKIDAITHIITTIAGSDSGLYNGDGIPATTAHINPMFVTGDNNGNLYIADTHNNRIRNINLSGYISTIAGTGTSGFSGDGGNADSAQMYEPISVALDDCNNVLFDDDGNYRIRKITYPSYPTITISDGISSTDNTNLCYGMPVTFTSTATLTGYAPVYQWKVNGINVGTSSPIYTYSPVNGDSIQCVLTSNLYCVTANTAYSNALHLVVDTLSVPIVTLSGVTGAPIGDTVTVNATITGAASGYLLHWKNHGIEFAATTVPSVSYIKTLAVDSITATLASNGRGCYDSAFSGAKIVANTTSTPSPFSTSGEGVTCYPNPATSLLYVVAGFDMESVVVSDIMGQTMPVTIGSATGNTKQKEINIAGLKPGIYFVKINGFYTQKLLKL